MREQVDLKSQAHQRRWDAMIVSASLALLGLFAPLSADAQEKPPSTNSAPSHRNLLIAPSSTSVSGGKATLTIGALRFETNAYVGEFQMKVNPYFFKNEKGMLSIEAPEESVKKLTNGIAVDFTGKAFSSGTKKIRAINGTATPTNRDQGTVTLWFIASGRKLIFNTTYRFDEK